MSGALCMCLPPKVRLRAGAAIMIDPDKQGVCLPWIDAAADTALLRLKDR